MVGGAGIGTLTVEDGGYLRSGGVSGGDAYVGRSSGGKGEVVVAGAGSRWVNDHDAFLGYDGAGSLTVRDDGEMTSGTITVGSAGRIILDVSGDDMISVTASLENNGTVRLVAGGGLVDGTYVPISAGSWSGTGSYEAFGGMWDGTLHTFTVAALLSGNSGVKTVVDLSDAPRLDVTEVSR